MVSSPFHAGMPGSLNFDTTLPPKLDVNVGARSHFFQPPSTPSASSSLHKSTASVSSQDASCCNRRKRPRQHSCISNQATPYPAGSHGPTIASDTVGTQSPPPFVSTRYELAGGLDTPKAATFLAMEFRETDYQASSGLYSRGGRGFSTFDLTSDGYFPPPSTALGREGNGRSRLPAPPPLRDGLGKMVYGVVGVAGKVLEFCKATAFRGFYAGGGQGYQMKVPAQSMKGDQSIWLDMDKEGVSQFCERERGLIPGRFPDDDYIPDYMSQDHTTPPRAHKRIQREKGEGEMSASWVMVDSTSSRESSPSRLSHRKVPSAAAAASTRRPNLKYGRRPIQPASRPSLTSYAGSPGLRSNRPASFASTRSPLSSPKHESPASTDLQRHAAKMRKRELEEDANLKRLNQQLKAMIKEGKEALGTKFEVQDEPIDEGYAEGAYYDDMEKG